MIFAEKSKQVDTSAWELLLPEGLLAYYDVRSVEKDEDGYKIYLDEVDLKPGEYAGRKLSFHGWSEAVTIKDFPIRHHACYLVIKRRRWLDEETRKTITRDWDMVAKGTRLTQEFATFLKELY